MSNTDNYNCTDVYDDDRDDNIMHVSIVLSTSFIYMYDYCTCLYVKLLNQA